MSGQQAIRCSRNQTCRTQMQHSKYDDLKARPIPRALNVSASKAGTQQCPFSICSWSTSNPISTPSRSLKNMIWPRMASSKARIRLWLQSWYEELNMLDCSQIHFIWQIICKVGSKDIHRSRLFCPRYSSWSWDFGHSWPETLIEWRKNNEPFVVGDSQNSWIFFYG